MEAIDLDHLSMWIGREQRAVDHLDPFRARALAAALNRTRLPELGDPLPPSWHWIYFLDTPTGVGTAADGHPHKGGFLPPVPLERRMWASGCLDVSRQLRIGLPAEKVSTIRSLEVKQGRSGTLVFVNLEHRLQQQGEPCIREEQQLVYRSLPAGQVALPRGETAPLNVDWSHTFQPEPVLLFRFSALTYNAHRIHYDRDYATRRELYPGLVVHGPLLATLLLELVSQQAPGCRVSQFRFRAVRPTFDLAPIHLRGRRQGKNVELWSADHENFTGVIASAVLEE